MVWKNQPQGHESRRAAPPPASATLASCHRQGNRPHSYLVKAGEQALVVWVQESGGLTTSATTQVQTQGFELAHPKSSPSKNCWNR